jgi:hypothetical protein
MLKNLYDRLRVFGRGEWLAIAFAGAILALLVAAASGGFRWGIPNFGFGPDWKCAYVGKGDPVCVKQPAKPLPPSSGAEPERASELRGVGK